MIWSLRVKSIWRRLITGESARSSSEWRCAPGGPRSSMTPFTRRIEPLRTKTKSLQQREEREMIQGSLTMSSIIRLSIYPSRAFPTWRSRSWRPSQYRQPSTSPRWTSVWKNFLATMINLRLLISSCHRPNFWCKSTICRPAGSRWLQWQRDWALCLTGYAGRTSLLSRKSELCQSSASLPNTYEQEYLTCCLSQEGYQQQRHTQRDRRAHSRGVYRLIITV